MSQDLGETTLINGQQLREQGKTWEAVAELDRAMEIFLQNGNWPRFAHAFLDRAICWQHLYGASGDGIYVTLYKADAQAMLEIIQQKNISSELDQAYFVNGKAVMLQKDYVRAVDFFDKATNMIPTERAQQKGDWMTNLGKALYLAGEKQLGRQKMLEGIEQIKNFSSAEKTYETNVWASGGYLRLAEVLKIDDPAASQQYLSEAQKIIGSDPKQIIRKQQLEKFLKIGVADL